MPVSSRSCEQQRGDQEAGQDEEEVDAEVAALEVTGVEERTRRPPATQAVEGGDAETGNR